jgi:hypothetical protein
VPQTHQARRTDAYIYSSRSSSEPTAGDGLSLESLALRRWPIWAGRFGLLALFAVSIPALRLAVENVQGREFLLMLGLAACVLVAVFLIWAHQTITKEGKQPRTKLMKSALTFGASCVSVAVFLAGTQADPAHVHTKTSDAHRPVPAGPDGSAGLAIHHDHLDALPRFSARMTGASQAPVSLVFLGSGSELLDVFSAAGWHAAERITPTTALRAFGRGVLNRPYHCAPVFPSFLEGKLHDVAFQKTDPGGSSRRRHHARWWLTDLSCEGRQVWVATASYDAGVGVGRLFPMPVHHIHPDIDAERDYITHSLVDTRRVRVTQEVRVTEPMAGRNAAGDRFYTQGIALVLA